MKIAEMNWPQLDAMLADGKRAVIPLGCTEQHAFLSLSTDSILAERVAVEAAAPLGVPVFPVLPYGITPYSSAIPELSRCASRPIPGCCRIFSTACRGRASGSSSS